MQKQLGHLDEATPVHLMNAVRMKAEELSVEQGVSLDEFVNAAVAEKLAQHEQHLKWLKSRREPTEERLAEARRILRKAGSEPPQPGDELPDGYVWPEI